MFDLSVVIPVRDEEANLPELVTRLKNVIHDLKLSFEIIFVTDVNRDNTFSVLKSLNRDDPRVKVLKLSNSFGQHVAVCAGLNFCRGNAVVIMDGDLQDYPEDIPKLYNKLNEGYDAVYSIKERKNASAVRNIFSKSFVKLINMLSDQKLDHNTSMFRIMSRRTVDELLKFKEHEPNLTGLVSLIGFPTAKVTVSSGKRKIGKTKYSYLRLIGLSISVLLSFTNKPVRVISMFGLTVSVFSFLYLVVVLVQTFLGHIELLGWPSIIAVITFLSGVQLLAIGVIGEYIGRIFLESKNRPLYIIEEKIGDLE
jgi:dolichol-phosphate mannosyltransferase